MQKVLKAIWVPQAGIIDYKQVAMKLKSLIESNGGNIHNAKVQSMHRQSNGWVITTTNEVYQADYVITCGGLHSDRLARMTDDRLTSNYPLQENVYLEAYCIIPGQYIDIPSTQSCFFPFLVSHFTSMVHGGREAGPNAVWALGREAYNWKTIDWSDAREAIAYPDLEK